MKEEDLDQIVGNDLILKEAYEELNRFSWSKADLRTYDSVDMKTSADKTPYEDGFGDGKKEIAQNFLKKGFSTEMIYKITGLSIEEIENLETPLLMPSS
jgi:hypothetical protein